MNKIETKFEVSISRRKVLTWSTPTIAAIALPVHATMSPCIDAGLVVTAVQPKCSGDPVTGVSTIELFSTNDVVAIEILSVEVTGASADDSVTVPTLPATASTTDAVVIDWNGPATDALTCLPLNAITLTVGYSCGGSVVSITETFSLTELLADTL